MRVKHNRTKSTIKHACLILSLLSLWVGLISGCNGQLPGVKPSLTPTPTSTGTPTPTATPTLTPTPLPPIVVLLTPPGADPELINFLMPLLSTLTSEAGYRFQTRPMLDLQDFDQDIRLVVIPAVLEGIDDWVKASPQTQFLAIGVPGLQTASNLTTIAAEKIRPDQIGFIAGAVAAILTEEWRVGAITIADTPAGMAARNGFINGVIYVCGLCKQNYTPFYNYPLYFELSQDSSSIEWQVAASYMVDHYVKTVFITPGVKDETMLGILSQAGITLIGEKLPSPDLSTAWAVSLSSDILPIIQQTLPELFNNHSLGIIPTPLDFSQINPDLFSPGRQILARKYLVDLLAGVIATGVDPVTGEMVQP